MRKLSNVEAILAVDSMNGLAKNGKLPWKSETDMKFFRNITLGYNVVMGITTFLSLPNSQPLKKRTNFVITNNKEKYSNIYKDIENLYFVSLQEIIDRMKYDESDDLDYVNRYFIVGGKQIYDLLIPYCCCVHLTKFKKSYNCDLIYDISILNKYFKTKDELYCDDELELLLFT